LKELTRERGRGRRKKSCAARKKSGKKLAFLRSMKNGDITSEGSIKKKIRRGRGRGKF